MDKTEEQKGEVPDSTTSPFWVRIESQSERVKRRGGRCHSHKSHIMISVGISITYSCGGERPKREAAMAMDIAIAKLSSLSGDESVNC